MQNSLNHARLLCQLLAVAGLAQCAAAQNSNTGTDRQGTTQTTKSGQPSNTQMRGNDNARMTRNMNGADGVDFRSAKWMRGRDIVNMNNQSVGDVSDLIIDRGSGKIRYVIVKTGTTLGMGGRSVALPYSQFNLNAASGNLVLNTSADQLNQYPEFTDESWNNLRSSTYDHDGSGMNTSRNNTGVTGNPPNDATSRMGSNKSRNFNDWMWSESAPYGGDSYSSTWDSARKEKIEGEVKKVSRESSPHGQDVVVEIASQDGTTKKVALGPAWYIGGSETSINRGDKISLEVMPIYVATSTTVNGRNMTLRDEKGMGTWGGRSFGSGKDSYSAPYYRHARLSTLMGATVDCRGTECGTVNDLVIESNSGTIAFVSIDPNQNFLGIADTKRMVPWSIVSLGMNNHVRVDAAKDMILASPETPSDLASLNGNGRTDSIYNAYQVPVRGADSYRSGYDNNSNWNTGWGDQSDRDRPNSDRVNPSANPNSRDTDSRNQTDRNNSNQSDRDRPNSDRVNPSSNPNQPGTSKPR